MDFNSEPYWDDFEATNGALEKNYMRILFRPGYAVQARELTQLQSILQNQIKQFGDHIFADGSPVIGGHLSIDTNVTYVKINNQQSGVDVDLDDFSGLVVFNSGSPVTRAKVIQTYSTESEKTLLVKYIRGPGFSAGQTISTPGGATATVQSTSFTGTGSTISINNGVFYVDGYFVNVSPQTIVLDPYSATPTYKVGLEIDETIVTENQDTALLDPAQESFNYQAPGAHRYQFDLVLAKRLITSVDDSRFFELLRVENGVITKQVSYPIYSELEKTLARRTYDESGDYTVRPFIGDVSANTANASEFIVNLSPGKAYVKGMEFETIGTSKITLPRATTTKTSSGYDLSAYYGNRILVTDVSTSNLHPSIVTESLPTIDLHCVTNNIVTTTVTGSNTGATSLYYATKIGSARIRNIERTSSQNVYYLYLTEMNFQPITTAANATSANASSINLRPEFSTTSNAYQNAKITLVNTVGAIGNVSRVISYDGATRIAQVSPPFANTPQSNDVISITMGIEDVESLVSPNTASFGAINVQMNVASVGKDATGNVYIEDSKYDREIFSLPDFYVTQNSDKAVEIYRKSIFENQTFTLSGSNCNTTITLSAGQGTFDFGTDGALVSSADVKENLILVANNGQIIDLTTSSRTVYRSSQTVITIDARDLFGASFTGDVYVTTKVSNANGSLRRAKTLVQSNAAITAFDVLASATAIPNWGGVRINASNGVVWFTNASVITTTTVDKQSLFVPDVVRINKIYQSGNILFAPNTTNFTDITSRYLFDSGQCDSYYDYASIRLKPDAQPPVGQTAVFFDYYTHTGTGYLSSSSYPASQYNSEQIPVYRSGTGTLIYQRDAIDFRPIRQIGTSGNPFLTYSVNATVNVVASSINVVANTARTSNTIVPPIGVGTIIRIGTEQRTVNAVINAIAVTVSSPFTSTATNTGISVVTPNTVFSGGIIHRPTDPVTLDYDFYLPRKDKIVVTKDKAFKLLSGIPDSVPQEPVEDSETAMTIYKVHVPAYTSSLRNISLEFVDNRRYTMKDIASIDNRLLALEEFIQMKESEQQIISDPPKSPNNPNVNKPIYGTLVDEFNDLTVVDMNTDFAAAIENGMLSCYKHTVPIGLQVKNISTSTQGAKFITLPYTESSMVSQGLATSDGSQTVVPDSLIAKFNGYVTLTPESDYFYSTQHIPSFSDILGMYYSVYQNPRPISPSLTTTVISNMGAGQYSNLTSNAAATSLTGTAVSVLNQYTVTVPAYSSNVAQTEPSYTNQINMNFVGVMPYTSLDTNWTGIMSTPRADSADPNAYDPYSAFRQGEMYKALASYYGIP